MTVDAADMQAVMLDNEERRVVNEFRVAKQNEFSDLTVKIHRGELVAIFSTKKWSKTSGALREVGE